MPEMCGGVPERRQKERNGLEKRKKCQQLLPNRVAQFRDIDVAKLDCES